MLMMSITFRSVRYGLCSCTGVTCVGSDFWCHVCWLRILVSCVLAQISEATPVREQGP